MTTNHIPTNLSKISKSELLRRDILGHTILHLIILTNRYDLLKEILRNSDIKTIIQLTDYESGWNCLHYVIFHKRITCFKVLLDYFKLLCNKQNTLLLGPNSSFVELVKCKDRNNVTPFQLMNNDYKTFIWVPDHINEKDQIELSYRYRSTEILEKVPRVKWNSYRDGCEVYTFGTNQFGSRSSPSKLSHEPFLSTSTNLYERLQRPRYRKIEVSKNHTVILTKEGQLYSSGKGSRGRLGHKNLRDCVKFESIDIEKSIENFAISNNHCIALTNTNQIYSWGLNSLNQLGFESTNEKGFSEIFDLTPSPVYGDLRASGKILGICVSKIHSVAYTDLEIISWGLNIGQMGFSSYHSSVNYKVDTTDYKGSIQVHPKSYQVRNEKIKWVDTCEECTFIVTTKNEIHVLYQHAYFKLPKIPLKSSTDNHFDKFKPTMLTEAIVIKKLIANNSSRCILLLENGDIMSFGFDINEYKNTKYSYLWKANGPGMLAIDLNCSADGSLVLCTVNGSVFIKSNMKQRANSFTDMAMPTNTTGKNKFKKIEGLNKIVQVSTDVNFSSFAFIRDDVDLLPLRIQRNDFFDDIANLSDLKERNFFRKQDQMLDTAVSETYLTRFFPEVLEDDEVEDATSTTVTDILIVKYLNKFDGLGNTLRGTYTKVDLTKELLRAFKYDLDSVLLRASLGKLDAAVAKPLVQLLLLSPLEFLEALVLASLALAALSLSLSSQESPASPLSQSSALQSLPEHDCYILIENHPTFKIGIHKQIFKVRSKAFEKLFDPTRTSDLFVSGDLKALYDKDESTLTFNSVHFISIIIFVNFVYSSETLLSLPEFEIQGYDTKLVDKITREVENLKISFGVSDHNLLLNGVDTLLDKYSDLIDDSSGDVSIQLKDCEIKCHSHILRERSAFFETLLSSRWEKSSECVDFTEHTKSTFYPILKYIYGSKVEDVFDLGHSYDEIDLYINDLLDLVELSDELLLFQLKDLCQVVISEFINLDNVVVLLAHSDNLLAKKLFLNCAWYIYNNLDLLIIDPTFNELSYDLLIKLEKQITFFQKCKTIQFDTDLCTVNINDDNPNEFFEYKSNQLIGEWFGELSTFNDHFISDRKGFMPFEPLIDLKRSTTSQNGYGKKSSRKSSTLNNDILAFRSSVAEKELPSDAIEEQDFEVVTKGRRKSKQLNKIPNSIPATLPKAGSPSTQQTDRKITPAPSFAAPRRVSPPPSVPVPRRLSTSRMDPTYSGSWSQSLSPPLVASPPISGLSPFSNWASKSAGTSILKDQPITKTKVKLGPIVKLSQKERKKLLVESTLAAEEKPTSVTPVVFENPWKVNSSEAINASDSKLPILGKRNGSASSISSGYSASTNNSQSNIAAALSSRTVNGEFHSVYSTPSLTEIMIQELLLVEQAKIKDNEKKSFAEIQQEQEFAKWWEEESLRVQKQTEGSSKKFKSKPPKENKVKPKKSFDIPKKSSDIPKKPADTRRKPSKEKTDNKAEISLF